MTDRLTDAELVAVLIAHRDLGSAGAARKIGLGIRQFRQRVQDAKARGLTANTPINSEADKLKVEVTRLRAENVLLKGRQDTAERIREEIYGLASLDVGTPTWAITRGRTKGLTGVPMTIWSDWHWGETVVKAQVGGVNEFNQAVAEARVRHLVATTISLCQDHMVNPQYPGIVVALGGDMITGAIHEELAVTNWGTTQQQFIQVQEAIEWGLLEMAKAFGKVFVPCVVGNHGRDTIKPRFKNRVFQNYEWNLYMQLAKTFSKDRRFRFLVPEDTDAHFKIYDHRFLLTHGDTLGVKGGDGIIGALGPIARGATKVGRAEAQIGRDFDTLLMGHYHTYIPSNDAVPVIVNGALKGYDEYARSALRVRYSRPSQALWFVHPDHGVTAQWQVFLDKKQTAMPKSEWLTFEQRKA
jgi:predicted phosphodiesterase